MKWIVYRYIDAKCSGYNAIKSADYADKLKINGLILKTEVMQNRSCLTFYAVMWEGMHSLKKSKLGS